MDKPFIFCHMETSLDGKIMGKYLWIPETNVGGDNGSFETIMNGPKAKYHFQAMMNGRTTIDDNFTLYKKPAVDENAPIVPEGDFLADGAKLGQYLIAVDGHGRLAWETNENDYDGIRAHVVEIITEAASNAYKDFLRKRGISYFICGKDHVDLALACDKIKNILHVDTMLLGGGAVLNWSMIQAGLVDEVSQVIAPAADGSTTTQTLFMAKDGITDDQPWVFSPEEVEVMPDKCVWIRWKVVKKSGYDFAKDKDYQEVQEMLAAHKGNE